MKRFFYENKLSSQNITAKSNVAWVADITSIELGEGQLLHVFLCIDIHTNKIVAHTTGKRTLTSRSIVKALEKAIDKRFVIVPRIPVIIHTDRGTQFSSQIYNDFISKYEKFVSPSMSRMNTPTDNSVAERYMRTFKEFKIHNQSIQEYLINELITEGEIKSGRKAVNKYVKTLNSTPNRKSLSKSPEQHDKDVSTASMLMVDPFHTKAFSEHFGKDVRRESIEQFKLENSKVIGVLQELAARKSELVEKTPFDDFENNLALQLIDQRLSELYSLIAQSPERTREYVEDAIEPISDSLEGLHEKVDILLPKKKRLREVRQLRDPLEQNLFPLFIGNAGNVYKQAHEIKRAQLRITYTILYYTGFRLNEIRKLTQVDIQKAIESSQFNIVHYKTNKAHIHVLSKKAVQDLKKLTLEYKVLFEKNKYKFLFGKEQPLTTSSLIRFVNKDLAHTCQVGDIPYNIKSHSFRINVISSLLRVTSVQNTAQIMGHEDIRSTMYYQRYSLSKIEIQDLLEKINETKNDQ